MTLFTLPERPEPDLVEADWVDGSSNNFFLQETLDAHSIKVARAVFAACIAEAESQVPHHTGCGLRLAHTYRQMMEQIK